VADEIYITDVGIGASLLFISTATLITDSISSSELLNILASMFLADSSEALEKLLVVIKFPEIPKIVFPLHKRLFYENEIISYVGGTEQRILKINEEKYKIGLNYSTLTEDDKNIIDVLFNDTVRGKEKTILWIDPKTKERHYVRFEEDDLNREYFEYKLHKLNKIDLVEVGIEKEI